MALRAFSHQRRSSLCTSADHYKPASAGLKVFSKFQRLAYIVIVDYRGDVGRQPHRVVGGARYIGQYDGDAGRNDVAVFQKKRNSRDTGHHDRVKMHVRVFLVQEIRRAQGVCRIRPPRQIKKLGFDFKALGEFSQRLAKSF